MSAVQALSVPIQALIKSLVVDGGVVAVVVDDGVVDGVLLLLLYMLMLPRSAASVMLALESNVDMPLCCDDENNSVVDLGRDGNTNLDDDDDDDDEIAVKQSMDPTRVDRLKRMTAPTIVVTLRCWFPSECFFVMISSLSCCGALASFGSPVPVCGCFSGSVSTTATTRLFGWLGRNLPKECSLKPPRSGRY